MLVLQNQFQVKPAGITSKPEGYYKIRQRGNPEVWPLAITKSLRSEKELQL